MVRGKHFYTKKSEFTQNNTVFNSQLEILPNMIPRSIPANTSIDQNIVEMRSKQSKVIARIFVKNLKQIMKTGFQPRIQTTCFNRNPNINYTEITESILHSDVTGISPQTSSTLIPDITIPLQIPSKIVQSSPDSLNDSNISKMS